jgi:osmotically-inducible protein OsmY
VSDIRERIKKELARTVDEEMNRISVKTSNGRVALSGAVRSWTDDAGARRAAWSVPGVTYVEDGLFIG